ncbi:TOMM precursor leader peptide-binding protein [Rubeoparvulum massiliense]|uniref:TOMM precursor leader peptide-binding protein n=1 Tax=Rubeoparvulum massiliense TaxID=1631346 RepID=UPI00065E992A|nr:TOMM precursor leader peptide-binding protein [Rubeoparvulum massiliense]
MLIQSYVKLRDSVTYLWVRDDQVIIRGLQRSFQFQGEGVQRVLHPLLPELTGRKRINELAEALAIPSEELQEAIQALLSRNLIEVSPEPVEAPTFQGMVQRTFQHLGVLQQKQLMQKAPILLVGNGLLFMEVTRHLQQMNYAEVTVIYLLENQPAISLYQTYTNIPEENIEKLMMDYTKVSSIRVASTEEECFAMVKQELNGRTSKLLVALRDYEDLPFFLALNRLALEMKTAFLPGYVNGMGGGYGPFVIPHETACYQCYYTRLQSNQTHHLEVAQVDAAVEQGLLQKPQQDEYHGLAISYLSQRLALDIFKWVHYETLYVEPDANMHTLDIHLLRQPMEKRHRIMRVPRCPTCHGQDRPMVKPFMSPYAYQEEREKTEPVSQR